MPDTSRHLPIATLREGPLHAALKRWMARPGDRVEVPLDGMQIDLMRGDLLIEIQTGTFTPLRRKLDRLLDDHEVRVVHPVAIDKWIVRLDDQGEVLGRRRSPKRGRLENAFAQLVSIARLLDHPRLTLDLVLTQEDEVRQHAPGRVWRRKGWVIVERRLVDVLDVRHLATGDDFRALLPDGLPSPFTTGDVAEGLGIARDLARQLVYCLREAGFVEAVGKRGHARAYVLPS
jgi:hypothetical protein